MSKTKKTSDHSSIKKTNTTSQKSCHNNNRGHTANKQKSCHEHNHSASGNTASPGQIHICTQHSSTHPNTILEAPGKCAICHKILTPHHGNYYMCPMCAGIFSLTPNSCPKCGMELNLVRRTAGKDLASEAAQKKEVDRFILSAVLTIGIMLIAMLPGAFSFLGNIFPKIPYSLLTAVLSFIFTSVVVLYCGKSILKKSVASIKGGLNMYSLVGLGLTLAYTFSTAVLLGKMLFLLLPSQTLALQSTGGFFLITMLASTPLYFESAASIVTLMILGEIIEGRARNKAGDAIGALLAYAPKKATRITNKGDEEIEIEHVKVGDLLRVLPGEKIPADGVVTSGESEVIEAMLTGEAFPVSKVSGSKVSAGTQNSIGSLVLRVSAVGNETSLAKITARVETAMKSRPPIAKTVDAITVYFVPIVIGIAVVAFFSWLYFSTGNLQTRLFFATIAAISTLIIACPCALGLATPLSISMSAKKGAEYGLFFQDATSLEALNKVTTLYTDKTGTLTVGKPELVGAALPTSPTLANNKTKAVSANPKTREKLSELITKATALEKASEHPLASAFKSAKLNNKNGMDNNIKVSEFKVEVGKGVSGIINSTQHILGNEKMMREKKIDLSAVHGKEEKKNNAASEKNKYLQIINIAQLAEIKKNSNENETNTNLEEDDNIYARCSRIFHAIGGELCAVYYLEDMLRPENKQALQRLKKNGITTIMLSGDSEDSCKAAAKQLNIPFHAQLSPQQKADIINAGNKSSVGLSAMLGDGINDAPALVSANVGIAVSEGSSIATESAHLVVTHGSLLRVAQAVTLSRATQKNIFSGLAFAFGYNILGIPIAAGVFYPLLGITLQPMVAAAAMAASSLCVTINALLLGRKKL